MWYKKRKLRFWYLLCVSAKKELLTCFCLVFICLKFICLKIKRKHKETNFMLKRDFALNCVVHVWIENKRKLTRNCFIFIFMRYFVEYSIGFILEQIFSHSMIQTKNFAMNAIVEHEIKFIHPVNWLFAIFC